MALLDDFVGRVKKLEGFVPKVHGDYGNNSIGYGIRTTDPEELAGKAITEAEADARLRARAQQEIDAVRTYGQKHGYNWDDNQVGALASFRFNVGNLDQLTGGGTRTNEQIASMMPEYNKAGGKVNSGLVNRRQTEVDWFNSGQPTQPQQTAQIAPTAVPTAAPAFMPSVANQVPQQQPTQPVQQVARAPDEGIRQFQQQDPLTMFRYLSNQQQEPTDMRSWLRS